MGVARGGGSMRDGASSFPSPLLPYGTILHVRAINSFMISFEPP